MKGMKIGIDFGSSSLKIFAEGKGIVVDDPSVVAFDSLSGNPIAFGVAADNVYGRCGNDIEISKVIKNAVVSDFVMAERMLRYYLQRVCGNRIYKPNIILSLPSNISNLEKNTFLDIITLAGAGRVCMVDGILASAIGCGIATDKLGGRMVIDIGHHITEFAIVTLGGVAAKGVIKRGSYEIDKAIINHLKRNRDILIGPHTAREIKNKITSAIDRECETALFVSGKSCLDDLPISFEVTSSEIFPYIDEQVNLIIKEIHNEILNVSPDLLADAADHGILLCGGGSLVFDIAERLSYELDIRCEVVEEPRLAKIKGLGRLMSDEKLLENNGYRFIFKDEIKNRKNK
ncbi:MAG: rod shape-determining protein [Clostridia bacterium]|nr:rod shape-determining protein [Clostridia bacterium]